jgi:hypothetical protein
VSVLLGKSDTSLFLSVNILGLGAEWRTDAGSLLCGGDSPSFPVTPISRKRVYLLCGLDHKPLT